MIKMTEQALTIVLSDDGLFNNLTKDQTLMMLLTFKDAKYNKGIQEMKIKHKTYSIYNKLHSAIISLAFANNKNDLTKILDSHARINSLLNQVYESDANAQDAFIRLMMAEYKELVYNSIYDPYFDRIEAALHGIYEKIVTEKEEYFDVQNHCHDPTHYMFADMKLYDFYDMIECKGLNILCDQHNNDSYDSDDWMDN